MRILAILVVALSNVALCARIAAPVNEQHDNIKHRTLQNINIHRDSYKDNDHMLRNSSLPGQSHSNFVSETSRLTSPNRRHALRKRMFSNIGGMKRVLGDIKLNLLKPSYPINKTDPEEKYNHNLKAWQKDPFIYYEINTRSTLGEGGFGKVYKGQLKQSFRVDRNIPNDLVSNYIAVKVVNCYQRSTRIYNAAEEVEFLQSLQSTEAVESNIIEETLELSSDNNIVKFYDSFVTNHFYVIIMEYMDYGSLENILTRYSFNGMSESIIAWICHEILHGLQYMHLKRVLHRDIKPGNILVGKKGAIKIADFGLSSKLIPSSHGLISLSNERVGTTLYMAPEIRYSKQTYGTEIDVWSFGILSLRLSVGLIFDHDLRALVEHKISKVGFRAGFQDYSIFKHTSSVFRDFLAATLNVQDNERANISVLLNHPFIIGYTSKGKTDWLMLLSNR